MVKVTPEEIKNAVIPFKTVMFVKSVIKKWKMKGRRMSEQQEKKLSNLSSRIKNKSKSTRMAQSKK